MSASRPVFVSVIILAGTLLTAVAEPGSPESGLVPIHSGNHPDFGRVVFDTPPNVSYRVTRDGDRVTVRFPDTVKLGVAPVSLRNVLSLRSNVAQAELTVAVGASLHDMRMGSRVVVDVFDPVPNHGTPATVASGQPPVSSPAPVASQASPPSPKPVSTETAAAPSSASSSSPEPLGGDSAVAPSDQHAGVPPNAKGAAIALAASDIVAERGDIKLTAADIRDMLDHADPAQRTQAQASPAALAEFVRDRVLHQALLAEARAARWDQNADVIARANDARDTVIVQSYVASREPADPNYPSEADIAATYAANKERFTVPKQYHVAQIVILVPAGASKDVDDAAQRRVQELRQQALKPAADFGELANQNSQDRATVGRGGDLGWLPEDQFVPALRNVVSRLSENAISEPVRSPEAWHIVKLLGTKPPSVPALDQVRDTLIQALRQARAQQAARAYVQNLLGKEPITLNEIDLAHRIAAVR
jgi:parvulin-like peptidyl-prolyl isomerase